MRALPGEPAAATEDDTGSVVGARFDLRYLVVGVYLGIVLTKSEVVSWYRIQEMFRFEAFHMYGVIGSAIAVAMVSVWLIARLGLRDPSGQPLAVERKDPRTVRALLGGTVFGLGWALTGACPGPIAALVGAGAWGYLLVLLGAMAGTMLYGRVRAGLPH